MPSLSRGKTPYLFDVNQCSHPPIECLNDLAFELTERVCRAFGIEPWGRALITFNVIKEKHGWAVRMGDCMTTPFRSKHQAVREANCLADAIRGHGVRTEVIVEDAEPGEPPPEPSNPASGLAP